MHANRDGEQPLPQDLEATLCGSCLFGTIVVVRTRPEDAEMGPPPWHTHSFCRNIHIAGGNGTHVFESPVYACDDYERNQRQEAPGAG